METSAVGSAREKLIGTWKLVSAASTTTSGGRSEPYGAKPTGLLTYTEEGRVSALISYEGRKPLSIGGGKPEEQAEAFRTFLAYAGSFTVNGEKVIHHVEVSSIENYVGRDLERNFLIDGERIALTTPPTPMNGKVLIFELVWERLTG